MNDVHNDQKDDIVHKMEMYLPEKKDEMPIITTQ